MYRGKVTAVDASGVYVQTAEYGTLGPCQAVVANYTVGDMVLCVNVGDDTSPELVVVGRLTAKGNATAGSTTDNAVARFDGTSGALQNSGVTIDDSNRVVIPGTHPGLKVGDGTTDGTVQVNGASGSFSSLQLLKGGLARWTLRRSSGSETGSNAGSDLQLLRYSDAESTLSTLTINRATGKITLPDVGATAGIEMGAGGPTITVGTGAPSHSPPNGSVYLRTDGTATTTLYVRAGGAWSALS